MFTKMSIGCMRSVAVSLRVTRRLTALIGGWLLGCLVTTSLFGAGAQLPDPQYKDYNVLITFRYVQDLISYETLLRQWLGTKPSKEYMDRLEEIIEIVHLQRHSDSASVIKRGPRAPQLQAASPAAVAGSYTLASSTPTAPFVGNQLVVLGAVPFANNTDATAVGFRRAPDCTLVETFLEPVNSFLTSANTVEIPNAQDYLHTLAGLTTTPDVFAKGCHASSLGRSAVNTAQVVGITAAGLTLVADENAGSGTLEVQESNGTSNTPTVVTLSQAEPLAFLSADVNGDGSNDIIASSLNDPATAQNSFAVYLSNGDGTFKPAQYFDADAGAFLMQDVNGDGKPDIVGRSFAGGIVVLLGNGDGTFQTAVASAATATLNGLAFASGDFDGDGKMDLLVGSAVLKGAGNGTFVVGTALAPTIVYDMGFSYTADVGDLNNDGKLDIVYTSSTNATVQVLLGVGDGTFTPGPRYASLPPGQRITITDVDGDGNLDAVVGNSDQGLFAQDSNDALAPMQQFLMGRGDGTFVGAPVYNAGTLSSNGALSGLSSEITGLPAGGATDFNGDGKADVLTYENSVDSSVTANALVLLPGDGTGKLGAPITSTVKVSPSAIATADLNGDGAADAVLVGAAPTGAAPRLAVLFNQGNGHFGSEQDYALSDVPSSVAVGDFNGDGHIDIAVGVQPQLGAAGDSGVYVLLGKADGTFAAPVKVDASSAPLSITAVDLNGDGRADLLIADGGFFSPGTSRQVNGALHVYLANSDGTFTAAVAPTTAATNYTLVQVGDLNGDGKPDLIVAGDVAGTTLGSGIANVYTLLGNGDGTFKPAVTLPLAGSDGVGAKSMTLADFNHDGILDVAVGSPSDFTEVLLGVGDGTLVHGLLALGQNPSAIGSVDLNGDHFPELLVGTAGGLAVFSNAATWAVAAGTTASTTALSASPNPATPGQAVTLTATVTSSAASAPTGTVTFLDGAATLGTAALAAGSATLSTTTLAAGSHSLTAQYGGDSVVAASTAGAVTLTVSAAVPDFTISASPTAGTAAAGESATTTVTLTPSGGFTGAVSLSCAGLPTGASCSFAPATVTVGTAAGTSTVTIATAVRTAQLATPANGGLNLFLPTGPALAIAFAPILVSRRRRRRRTASRLRAAVGWAGVALVYVTTLSACHDHHGTAGAAPPLGGTPAGTYSVTVSASSGSTTHAASYALTIT